MNSRQTVLFISHGSPFHAIEPSAAAAAWAALAEKIERPRAILMVSAHWESRVPLLGGNVKPETIHDFGGFPPALYDIRYAAPGALTVAEEAVQLLHKAGFANAAIDAHRGLDHGAWVPLLKMYPAADVPVVPLAVQPELDAAHHLALGQALAPLREAGVLIVGSGHMTHNLRDWFSHAGREGVAPYAQAFRDWVDQRVHAGDVDALLQWEQQAPYARRAHPSVEHFLPLFVALGAAGADAKVTSICSGYDGGVLAMDAYRFD